MISRSRFQIVHREMTTASQKVYAAVPITQLWTAPQIGAELKRTGVSMAINAVAGCLAGLVHNGLIQEPIRGQFKRAEIKEPAPKKPDPVLYEVKKEPMTPTTSKTETPVTKKSPLEILGELSSRANVLSDMVRKFGSDIENAAIEIQQQIENSESETGKLKQLQAILKSLG